MYSLHVQVLEMTTTTTTTSTKVRDDPFENERERLKQWEQTVSISSSSHATAAERYEAYLHRGRFYRQHEQYDKAIAGKPNCRFVSLSIISPSPDSHHSLSLSFPTNLPTRFQECITGRTAVVSSSRGIGKYLSDPTRLRGRVKRT